MVCRNRAILKRDVNVLEKVQRRVTKIPKQLQNLEYNQSLKYMNLTTLDVRRQRQ